MGLKKVRSGRKSDNHGDENEIDKLDHEPVFKSVLKYSIPAIVAMMVMAIYNIVDRIFIGQGVGEDALAGLTVAFPLFILVMAFAMMIGIGAASIVSISLGKKDRKEASLAMGNMMTLSFIISILIIIIGLFTLEPLLELLGGSENTLPYAVDYMRVIYIGVIFQIFGLALNAIVRAEGNYKLAMNTMIVASVTNIVLDYFFIMKFEWGVEGAALATIIGQSVTFFWLIYYFFIGKKSILKIPRKYFLLRYKMVKRIISIGVSQFLLQLGGSISFVIIDVSLLKYGGDYALAAMGAIHSVYSTVILPSSGVMQGVQPIIGYNHGANNRSRKRQAVVCGLLLCFLLSVIVTVFTELFPEVFLGMFLESGSEAMEEGIRGLRLFMLAVPVLGISILGTGFFQSIEKPKTAFFLGTVRQYALLIPLVLVLPLFSGLNGVWLSIPISDGLAVIITSFFLVKELR